MTNHYKRNMIPGGAVKRAIKWRLQFVYDHELKSYENWKDRMTMDFARHMSEPRKKVIDTAFKKRIQALRIVLWMLSENDSRSPDCPPAFDRKPTTERKKRE